MLVELVSGKKFECSHGVSLLDAAANAQISLPYSCKTGRCSSCKCRILSGRSEALAIEIGLSDDEKKAGYILSCIRTAASDLTIDAEDLDGIYIPEVKTLPARIDCLQKLAPDVMLATLRVPPTSAFSYLPGQYIDVIGPGAMRRSYSIANAPNCRGHLDLHIRAVHGGAMSDYWFNKAKENDLLRINGPLGSFFLRSCASLDLIFLATGTGIAPVKAMLEAITELSVDEQPRSVTVVWGGRVVADIYYDIQAIGGRHTFLPVLSQAHSEWSGARGYVQDALLENGPDLSDAVAYACGSQAMIASAKVELFKAGLAPNRFYSDAFVSSGSI
ncbi:FAD-binding oxidoreductase [Sphingorhabdus sp.]|uniref:FAD-binding oxidoreductase n=1 Tax=Sphingorhabdus sp. TaxID=1902408 RepID=UPI0025DEE19C|nr:FAD-binding oxidoreductase [Sphingorhabdus sp.]